MVLKETGVPGAKGDTGDPGPKRERGIGVVYICWGHDSCPDGGAQLMYAGRAEGYFMFIVEEMLYGFTIMHIRR